MRTIPGQTLLLCSEAARVLDRFAALWPRPPGACRLVCVTTAARVYDDAPWVRREIAALEGQGFRVETFDIAGKTESEVASGLGEADIVHVTGGNTYYLMEQIGRSGFAAVLREKLAGGMRYIGSSAGTVVACPEIDFIRDMDDASRAGLADFAGMGLIDFPVMPHIDHERYGPIARALCAEWRGSGTMLSLRDDQALVVRGAYAEVF